MCAWVVEKKEVVVDNAVVASAHQLASQAGIEILRSGGNAVDAAAATSFAIGVVEPFMSGLGAGGVINIRLSSGEQCAIDAYIQAPKKITSFDWSTTGHKEVGIPGIVAGFALALEKYGTMSIDKVLKPAIMLANNGFIIDSYIASNIASQVSRMNGAGVRLLLRDGFNPLKEGDRLINKSLGRSLELIAKEGSDAFYKGTIAEMIADDMDKNGGLITLEDLEDYEARAYEPLITSYRGLEIHGLPYAHGGVTVAHMLNLMERFDPKDIADGTVRYYHALAEVQKRVFMDRFTYYGDHRFASVPWEGILSKEYAEEQVSQIDLDRSSGNVGPGDPWKHDHTYVKPDRSLKSSYGSSLLGPEPEDTTSFSVVDKDRNVVATTQSNGAVFGSGICVPGGGFFLNDFIYGRGQVGFFPTTWHPNYLEPGKRPVNTHCPTIVLKDDKPFMAFGSPGGRRQHGACVQTFIHVVDHGMRVQDAASAPRIHCEGNTLWMEGRIPEAMRKTLRGMGHEVVDMPGTTMFFGGLNAVLVDQKTGKLHGGADPRRPCASVGY